jgi:hypothetical protein
MRPRPTIFGAVSTFPVLAPSRLRPRRTDAAPGVSAQLPSPVPLLLALLPSLQSREARDLRFRPHTAGTTNSEPVACFTGGRLTTLRCTTGPTTCLPRFLRSTARWLTRQPGALMCGESSAPDYQGVPETVSETGAITTEQRVDRPVYLQYVCTLGAVRGPFSNRSERNLVSNRRGPKKTSPRAGRLERKPRPIDVRS